MVICACIYVYMLTNGTTNRYRFRAFGKSMCLALDRLLALRAPDCSFAVVTGALSAYVSIYFGRLFTCLNSVNILQRGLFVVHCVKRNSSFITAMLCHDISEKRNETSNYIDVDFILNMMDLFCEQNDTIQ